MFIMPLCCKTCGQSGWPGETGLRVVSDISGVAVICDCGTSVETTSLKDQSILSTNEFVRIPAASNYSEYGVTEVRLGGSSPIFFQRIIEFPCKAYISPQDGPALAKEHALRTDGMLILCAMLPTDSMEDKTIKIAWSVHGLVEIDKLPTWYVHFFSAITHLANKFYKSALLDYAIAFETYVETLLANQLAQKYDQQVATYLLKQSWRIDERCKGLLELTTGHRLTERPDLYQPWDQNVRAIRNQLAHGDSISVDAGMAEKAHQATYQAIRWIQSIV